MIFELPIRCPLLQYSAMLYCGILFEKNRLYRYLHKMIGIFEVNFFDYIRILKNNVLNGFFSDDTSVYSTQVRIIVKGDISPFLYYYAIL